MTASEGTIQKYLSVLNRITFTLAILFMITGIVLIPVAGRVGEASAETLPNSNTSNADLADPLEPEIECSYGDWGTCSVDCGGGTQTRELLSGFSDVCIDLSQVCNTQVCRDACEPESCPTGCGFAGDPVYPDGCGGTMECPAVESCSECTQIGEQCSDEGACCAGLVCYRKPEDEDKKCWPSSEAGCQSKGQKCDEDYGDCCEGLVCWDGADGDSWCRKPVDCEGFWGDCVGEKCSQEGLRFFNVTQWPTFGGEECPDPLWESCQTEPCEGDCRGHWSECEGECGIGVRTYHVDAPAAEGGAECPYKDGAQEECSDLPACPVDCEGKWSECEGDCGTGTRTFHIDVPARNGGIACDYAGGFTEDCELESCAADCRGEWGPCEGGCGGIIGVKTYTVTSPAEPGGAACEFEDGEIVECQTDPCPIDCRGEWVNDCFGVCSVDNVETFTILVEARWGGEECEYEDGETLACTDGGCLNSSPDGGGIPVTGSDGIGKKSGVLSVIGGRLAGVQKLILFVGMMFFGISMVLEGVINKI